METLEKPKSQLSDEEEEESEEEISPEALAEQLLNFCKENNLEEAQQLLEKKADPTFMKDGWNSILWAACNGNEELVRILQKYGALSPYLRD